MEYKWLIYMSLKVLPFESVKLRCNDGINVTEFDHGSSEAQVSLVRFPKVSAQSGIANLVNIEAIFHNVILRLNPRMRKDRKNTLPSQKIATAKRDSAADASF